MHVLLVQGVLSMSDDHCPYGGRILHVDLSVGRVHCEKTRNYSKRWIGGRAVNTWMLLNRIAPGTLWNEPENILAFGVGALVGTLASGACRMSVDTLNVYNNALGSANVGGFFGAELKFAGYDNLIITGKAEKPVYLHISDSKVDICDAAIIWGKDTWETERTLRAFHGDQRLRIAAIGPAGENGVYQSCIICDRSAAAGGCGCGAVMGSKNLKAIAVRGKKSIPIAQPDDFIRALEREISHISKWEHITQIRRKGFYGALGGRADSKSWEEGYRPVRNGQDDSWDPDKIQQISEEYFQRFRTGTRACFSCPVSCKPLVRVDEGEYTVEGEGWWNNSANAFCTKIDSVRLDAAIFAHQMCNRLGLDIDNAGQAIAWAFECFEKGIITKEDTDGLSLEWGNHDAMITLLDQIARRKGLGEVLARGTVRAAKILGGGSESFALHVKKQDSLDGVRINKGWGFGVVLSPVGGRHLRGSLGGFWMRKEAVNSYDGVPHALWHSHNKKNLQDCLGLCSYIYGQTIDDWVSLFQAASGSKCTAEQLLIIGVREANLEKAFNTLHGNFTRRDDYPCRRYYHEPVKSGRFRGERIDHVMWEQMLDGYYGLYGWDIETGLQTREGLCSIEMEDVADLLGQYCRLIENRR